MSCFCFNSPKYCLIFIVIFLCCWHRLSGGVLFNFTYLRISFCYWDVIPFFGEYILCMISVFKFYWDLFYVLTYSLSYRMYSLHLRRMYILLLLGGVFYTYLSASSSRFIVFQSSVSLLILCLVVFSISESKVLKSPNIIIYFSLLFC